MTAGIEGSCSKKLHRDLGITQETAWQLAHRNRETREREGGSMFTGQVEVDKVCIGSKRTNMSKSKAKPKEPAEAGARRGTVGKSAVAWIGDRYSNRVAAQPISQTDATLLKGFVCDQTAPGVISLTDEPANHRVGVYVRRKARTDRMESFWGHLKRVYQRTFHKFSVKKIVRNVREFAGRHNILLCDTLSMLRLVAIGMARKRVWYQDLIANNGLPSGARKSA